MGICYNTCMLAEVIVQKSDSKDAKINLYGTSTDITSWVVGCVGCTLNMYAKEPPADLRCPALTVGDNQETAFAAVRVSPHILDTAQERLGDILATAACLQNVNVVTLLPQTKK